MPTPATVDAYVDAAPSVAQAALRELRHLILAELPTATERIRYGMPSYDYRGQRFIHFAAAKAHLGVYGLVHEDGVVPDGLSPFLDYRSTLRIPYDRPLPSAALAAAIRDKAAAVEEGH